jgi:hypothetical protein
MREYFILQFNMANRRLKEAGLEPMLGYVLIVAGFIGFTFFLFQKTEFAHYAYMLISLGLTTKLSEIKRNDFLKSCFKNNRYKVLRITENLAAALPFILFLLYKQYFFDSAILCLLSLILALTSFRTTVNISIPTPFYKKPFEFTVGFRNSLIVLMIPYILTIISISVQNFNLGIFALLLLFLLLIGFYTKPENEYFVWSFSMSPKKFLFEKLKTAIFYANILCLPIVIIMGFFNFTNIHLIMLFYFIGTVFLVTIIFAKYGSFPNEINIPEGLILVTCISFPPLLLIFAPYFYTKAIKKLERFLV